MPLCRLCGVGVSLGNGLVPSPIVAKPFTVSTSGNHRSPVGDVRCSRRSHATVGRSILRVGGLDCRSLRRRHGSRWLRQRVVDLALAGGNAKPTHGPRCYVAPRAAISPKIAMLPSQFRGEQVFQELSMIRREGFLCAKPLGQGGHHFGQQGFLLIDR
jgi:hypothetical protein